jgi:lipopolysaccharide export system protein LptC
MSLASASHEAARQLNRRQRFAAPGGKHDRLVRTLQLLLPAAVGVLSALLLLAPLSDRAELSFLLDKNDVAVARERLRVTEALYRGQDDDGRGFAIRAGSAVQASSADPTVRMADLVASIGLADGPAAVRARAGIYDPDRETVRVPGILQFDAAGGYDLVTSDVELLLRERRLVSRGSASGRTSVGTFRADRMVVDLESRTVRLDGNARLRVEPARLR